jgi:hypothetical protein
VSFPRSRPPCPSKRVNPMYVSVCAELTSASHSVWIVACPAGGDGVVHRGCGGGIDHSGLRP